MKDLGSDLGEKMKRGDILLSGAETEEESSI